MLFEKGILLKTMVSRRCGWCLRQLENSVLTFSILGRVTSRGLAQTASEFLNQRAAHQNIEGSLDFLQENEAGTPVAAIRDRTARNWLHKLGFKYRQEKGVFIHGQEGTQYICLVSTSLFYIVKSEM